VNFGDQPRTDRERTPWPWWVARRLRLASGLLLTALTLCSSGTTFAAEREGVVFPDRHTIRGVDLTLMGTALLRYRIFVKAYVAALWVGADVEPETVLSDAPKRLEIEYFWAIRAEDFAKSTSQGIAANVDADSFEQLQTRIRRLNALYRDVEPGDRYAITYLPGVGTELALNAEPLGTIEGADFSSAMFAIWLGEAPLDQSLKRQLLGEK
jgi:hypothetical protein